MAKVTYETLKNVQYFKKSRIFFWCVMKLAVPLHRFNKQLIVLHFKKFTKK